MHVPDIRKIGLQGLLSWGANCVAEAGAVMKWCRWSPWFSVGGSPLSDMKQMQEIAFKCDYILNPPNRDK